MTITIPTSALSPFYRHGVTITGRRRENNVARNLEVVLRDAAIMGGSPAALLDGAASPTNERIYSLGILRASWLDHYPPQIGDTVAPHDSATFPRMMIQAVVTNHTGWRCECRSVEPQVQPL